MQFSGLVTCFEVEQYRPCVYFKPNDVGCPNCYAEKLLPMRKQTSRHIHRHTPYHGLIRLGTYLEPIEKYWLEFKAGTGAYDCCGKSWFRPDFPKRPYFMISRGLEPMDFYERVLADKYLTNLQLSVDVLPELGFAVVPDEERIRRFAEFDSVIFRYKTTPANVHHIANLSDRLGIPRYRVMETTLHGGRKPEMHHNYGTETHLQKIGWDWHEFGRCNTVCSDCQYENGMLLCAARAKMLPILATKSRPPPPRLRVDQVKLPRGAIWRREATACMMAHGGTCTVKDFYAWLLAKWPELPKVNPYWQFKGRVGLQRAGTSLGNSTWELKPEYKAQLAQMKLGARVR